MRLIVYEIFPDLSRVFRYFSALFSLHFRLRKAPDSKDSQRTRERPSEALAYACQRILDGRRKYRLFMEYLFSRAGIVLSYKFQVLSSFDDIVFCGQHIDFLRSLLAWNLEL